MNTKALLSQVSVFLQKDGNIEVTHNNVAAEDFKQVMEDGLPNYTNTELIYNFMRRLENITEKYVDSKPQVAGSSPAEIAKKGDLPHTAF